MTSTDQFELDPLGMREHISFNRKDLNELISLTADMLKIPVIIISVAGYEKQFIKDSPGADLKPGSREVSFCHHLKAEEGLKIVPDARFDQYLESNFMASGNSSIRFYAGIPLVMSSGMPAGSLCLFDKKPRHLSVKEQKTLATMARQMVRLIEAETNLTTIHQLELELNKQKEQFIAAERKLRAFFKSSAFCHMLIGKDLEVIDFNKATALFIKEMYGKNVQVGKCVLDYISPLYKKEFMICLTRAFAGKRINREIFVKFENKAPAWWNIFLEPIKNDDGKVVAIVYNATDISDQKQRIAEIVAKNELLLSIAQIQSHEYRRPVASILGLMEVIRIGNQPLSEELQMLDAAAKELDQKIRTVIELTQALSFPDR
jgi:PAS domain S-box-containing protein